jgi:hypothetical protein
MNHDVVILLRGIGIGFQLTLFAVALQSYRKDHRRAAAAKAAV